MVKNKNLAIKFFSYPFDAIMKNKLEFFIWVVFTVICGQMGIIANIIIRYYSHDVSIVQSIGIEGSSGSFYTFSIALVASALGPMFTSFFRIKLEFKTIKIISIIILIMLLLFSGIIYAATQSKDATFQVSKDISYGFTQPIIYFISMLLVGYTFGVLKLNMTSHIEIEDESYADTEDASVNKQTTEVNDVTNDGNGVAV